MRRYEYSAPKDAETPLLGDRLPHVGATEISREALGAETVMFSCQKPG